MAGGGHDEKVGLRADLDMLRELLRLAEEDGNRRFAEAIRRVGRDRSGRLSRLDAQRLRHLARDDGAGQ